MARWSRSRAPRTCFRAGWSLSARRSPTVGKYPGRVAAANILGEPREANYDAVPRVTLTDPQAPILELPKTAACTRDHSNGFVTLLGDGERLTGAYALGPEAGECLQQATLAIRARVPLDLLRDTIQPFPAFSEVYLAARKGLRWADHGSRPAARSGEPVT